MGQEIERRIKEKCDELDALKKTYQKSIESMQASLENETRAKGEAIRQKKKLEHADRQRRGAEQELSDVMEQLSDTTLQNQALQTSKRKLDSELQTLQADLEEMLCETRIAEDKAKKAMIDAARLADELRAEQENAQHCEKNRRSLECQVKDMQTKLDEAEQQAVKGGRKVTSG